MVLCAVAAAVGLSWLGFIIANVIIAGLSALNLDLFLNDPRPAGMLGGGLRHAFVGQVLITFFATLFGVPIGVLAGTYLAEYGGRSRFARFASILADLLVGVPSIVIGAVVYAIMVRPVHHFSGWAGAIALALIMIPVVVRTTEDMLRLVPWSLREAAFALGAPKHKVIVQVVYRGAATGILTGILLAVARVAGETAPLLFTSFNNNFFSGNMNDSMASLPVSIFQYAMGPYDDWHRQAWAASFVITASILLVTIVGRTVLRARRQQ